MAELELWEQTVIEVGIELPIPEMPKPSVDWGGGGLGLDLTLTCPGAPFCGNPDVDKNCSISVKSPLKIPGFAVSLPIPEIKLPPMKIRVVVPPKVIIPINCPNYPNEEAAG